MFRGKNYVESAKLVEKATLYDAAEAFGLVIKASKAKFDDVYGARPLRRAIQSELEDALAEKMLEGAFKAGDTVRVDVKENALTFEQVNDET